MKKNWIVLMMTMLPLLLTACDYSKQEDRSGWFYFIFVKPIDMFCMDWESCLTTIMG